jgi:hypothetical protein
MISRAQVVLFISLLAWGLVLYQLISMRAASKVQHAKAQYLRMQVAISHTNQSIRAISKVSSGSMKKEPRVDAATAFSLSSQEIPQSTISQPQLTEAPNNIKNAQKRSAEYYQLGHQGMDWKTFAALPIAPAAPDHLFPKLNSSDINMCDASVIERLDARLSREELKWCQWALSDTGGKVKVRIRPLAACIVYHI